MTAPEPRLLDRVIKMLDRAEHPETPAAEADACRERADQMMAKYAIDAALLAARQSPADRERPIRRDIHLFEAYGALGSHLGNIAVTLADLADVRLAWLHSNQHHAVVGYSQDVDYFEVLFVGVRNQFQQRMYPKWDAARPVEENIYNFKKAGNSWEDVWYAGYRVLGADMPCARPPKDSGWLIRAYKRHAKAIGDTALVSTQRHDAYRRSYAAGFVNTLMDRVEVMTRARRAEEAASGSGAEVALRDRRQDIAEALYMEFPDLRPLTAEQRAAARAERLRREAAEAEAERVRRDKLTPAQRAAEDRKAQRDAEKDERAYAAWARRNARDEQGYGAGSTAAATADLSGGRNHLGGKREIQ